MFEEFFKIVIFIWLTIRNFRFLLNRTAAQLKLKAADAETPTLSHSPIHPDLRESVPEEATLT